MFDENGSERQGFRGHSLAKTDEEENKGSNEEA